MSRVSQARNLGKTFLLIDNMLVVLGFFVVFPLISIRFVDQMGWAAVMVGIALGLRQFIQQGLGIFGGAIADRFGAKPMIVTGMLMRAAGFATMGIAHEPWLLWFSCFLSGLGGTLFDPPRSALVVKLIRPHQRGRFFSILMMQDSAGAVIGALLGSWLLQYDFRLVCATGAILFVLCAAFNAWLLPAWKLSTVRIPVGADDGHHTGGGQLLGRQGSGARVTGVIFHHQVHLAAVDAAPGIGLIHQQAHDILHVLPFGGPFNERTVRKYRKITF